MVYQIQTEDKQHTHTLAQWYSVANEQWLCPKFADYTQNKISLYYYVVLLTYLDLEPADKEALHKAIQLYLESLGITNEKSFQKILMFPPDKADLKNANLLTYSIFHVMEKLAEVGRNPELPVTSLLIQRR